MKASIKYYESGQQALVDRQIAPEATDLAVWALWEFEYEVMRPPGNGAVITKLQHNHHIGVNEMLDDFFAIEGVETLAFQPYGMLLGRAVLASGGWNRMLPRIFAVVRRHIAKDENVELATQGPGTLAQAAETAARLIDRVMDSSGQGENLHNNLTELSRISRELSSPHYYLGTCSVLTRLLTQLEVFANPEGKEDEVYDDEVAIALKLTAKEANRLFWLLSIGSLFLTSVVMGEKVMDKLHPQ